MLSPVTLAVNFLSGMHSTTYAFADRLADKQADDAALQITRRMQQVFAFADIWHLLHMEFYGEHRLALDGARSAENPAPARRKKREGRKEIVRRECEVYWTKHGPRNASHTAKRLLSVVNKTLETQGHRTYTAESFEKLVREIFRESASQFKPDSN
jgi:predicted deacylase